MRSTHPPRAATWLLRHFGSSSNNESIIGDLSEGYQSGRSSGWYWRQVLLAIIAGVFAEIRPQKLRALVAVITGFAIVLALTWLAAPPFTRLQSRTIGVWGDDAATHFALFPVEAIIAAIMGITTGWILAPRHRTHHLGLLVLFGLCHMLWIFGSIIFWSVTYPASVPPNIIYFIRLAGFELVLFLSLLATPILLTSRRGPEPLKDIG